MRLDAWERCLFGEGSVGNACARSRLVKASQGGTSLDKAGNSSAIRIRESFSRKKNGGRRNIPRGETADLVVIWGWGDQRKSSLLKPSPTFTKQEISHFRALFHIGAGAVTVGGIDGESDFPLQRRSDQIRVTPTSSNRHEKPRSGDSHSGVTDLFHRSRVLCASKPFRRPGRLFQGPSGRSRKGTSSSTPALSSKAAQTLRASTGRRT